MALLSQFADGEAVEKVKIGDVETETLRSVGASDRLRALDMMAKYGLGTQQEIDLTSQGERIFVAEVPPKAVSEEAWSRSHKPR